MFAATFPPDLADVWTPVAFSHTLKSRPLARKLAGVDLVLFRDHQGKPGVLLDRCPHRGVKLSLGKVTADGCLACPFHGWEFKTDGACAHVPFSAQLDEGKRQNLAANGLPVVEKGGLLFVFTGTEPKDEPYVPSAVLRSDVSRSFLEKTWATGWTRAMENMLDWPHLPFVHAATIGRGLRKNLRREATMELDVAETPWGFRSRMRMRVGDKLVDGSETDDLLSEEGGFLDWNRPNGMTLNIPVPFGQWRQHVWCVPIDDTHVNMMMISTRAFGRMNPIWALADLSNRKVLSEDRAVVESSFPAVVPHASEEKSVATDKPTLLFRRWVRGRIEAHDGRREAAETSHLRIVS